MGIFNRDEAPSTDRPGPSAPATRAMSPPKVPGGGNTVVAPSSKVEGTVSGTADIRIEGEIEGTIDASGTVVVAEGGRASASLTAKVVSVSGQVRGDINGAEKIELEASADVQGNLTAPRILIREGATFEGKVNMRQPKQGGASSASATTGSTAGSRGDSKKK